MQPMQQISASSASTEQNFIDHLKSAIQKDIRAGTKSIEQIKTDALNSGAETQNIFSAVTALKKEEPDSTIQRRYKLLQEKLHLPNLVLTVTLVFHRNYQVL